MVRFQGLRSSIRLYGLVTVTGIHDQPALDPVQISCVGDLDAPTVRVFISRLDAEIYLRASHLRNYRVVPLRSFDPSQLLNQANGWLKLNICLGFAAQDDCLLSIDQQEVIPVGLTAWTRPVLDDQGYYLQWSDTELPEYLLSAYKSVGAPDYNRQLNELDDWAPAAMERTVAEALQMSPPFKAPGSTASQLALFDVEDACWRFGLLQIDGLGTTRNT
ncbi:hypothetical protein [Pseudomonas sp. S1Bt23]|uniref:hypothetical protein n=1 Tax=Pseudomonas sp. S1Bt23 TaxID=3095074 RepID=UPI002A598498|nr:hypothetical protein [Pseudomonas sp. S1Bt23]WPO48074.1 hypothetical protein SHB59_02985 [Pseudomonas sp. S1Bt23]